MQIQFVTKRGTNAFRGQVFDQIQSDKLNAHGGVNKSRAIPKTKLRQHECGANIGGPIIQDKLFFFGNYEQIYPPSETTPSAQRAQRRSAAGHLPLHAPPTTSSAPSTCSTSPARTASVERSIRSSPRSCRPSTRRSARATSSARRTCSRTPSASSTRRRRTTNIYPTARVDYQASPSLAHPRRAEPALARPADATRDTRACRRSATGSRRRTTSSRPARTGRCARTCSTRSASASQSNFEEFRPGNTLAIYDAARRTAASTCRSWTRRKSPATRCRFRATTRSTTSRTR